ncbi:hypothetical protein cypCar_00039413 [Cyprinus carpio]|nr:hypothetical protein cypCar_00039413 [Cyprinus carpio]
MKAGALHCRCAKCFSLPVRKRVRKRASAVTLLSLPEELLLFILIFVTLSIVTRASGLEAAEKGNFEAAAKLGIAYLYNEGPSLSEEGRADLCGRMASRYFSLAESLRSPLADPFIWLFIRPPWSTSGGCCKAVVYDRLEAESETNLAADPARYSGRGMRTLRDYAAKRMLGSSGTGRRMC